MFYYRMEEELDADTLIRGGVHFVCPICLEKTNLGEESYFKECCGQDICRTCSESYRDECERKSLKLTCEYCRAELPSSKEESNRLLKKRGSNHVCINMIDT